MKLSNKISPSCLFFCCNPIINAPKSKPVFPSTADTRNSTGLKICTSMLLALAGDQKVLSQPSQY